MIVHLQLNGKAYQANLNKPMDISIPLGQVKCFDAPDVKIEPFKNGSFVGSVNEGSPVNFYNVQMNPHGNGTHTECLGHITSAHESIGDHLKEYHLISQLISVVPDRLNADSIITKSNLANLIQDDCPNTLIIRSLPNEESKLNRNYSGTNPIYLEEEAIKYLVSIGIEHLLVDMPSIDREQDDGKLLGHKAFWQTESDQPRKNCTITELVYVPNEIEDGLYLLNIQIPPLKLDAAPSRPVLYEMITL